MTKLKCPCVTQQSIHLSRPFFRSRARLMPSPAPHSLSRLGPHRPCRPLRGRLRRREHGGDPGFRRRVLTAGANPASDVGGINLEGFDDLSGGRRTCLKKTMKPGDPTYGNPPTGSKVGMDRSPTECLPWVIRGGVLPPIAMEFSGGPSRCLSSRHRSQLLVPQSSWNNLKLRAKVLVGDSPRCRGERITAPLVPWAQDDVKACVTGVGLIPTAGACALESSGDQSSSRMTRLGKRSKVSPTRRRVRRAPPPTPLSPLLPSPFPENDKLLSFGSGMVSARGVLLGTLSPVPSRSREEQRGSRVLDRAGHQL